MEEMRGRLMPSPLVRWSFFMHMRTLSRVRRVAEQRGESAAEWVRDAVHQRLDRDGHGRKAEFQI